MHSSWLTTAACAIPQDGTTNFVHRQPYVCVSIALAVNSQVRRRLVLLVLFRISCRFPHWHRNTHCYAAAGCRHLLGSSTARCRPDRHLQVVVGVVHNPILGETFTAVRGGGALLNGQPVRASSESDLASALVATEVTSASSPHVWSASWQ